MSQDYSDDVFGTTQQVQTNMQQIEDNFAALKSAFSGTSSPPDPIGGMWWLDTTTHLLKVRNEANNAWLSVWDMANNKPIIANLSNEITGAMIASSIKDAAAGTASLRTLGTASTSACAGNDARLSDTRTPTNGTVSEAKMASAAVSQAKLKTSSGEVSIYDSAANLVLPGGEYGFYPQVYVDGNYVAAGIAEVYTGVSYPKVIYLPSSGNGSARKRYVTSSGEVFWVFIIRDKTTKKIASIWVAPDHPCFGNGGKPLLVPHPFPDFDPATKEIVVCNPSPAQVAEIEAKRDVDNDSIPDLSILGVINQFYEIDEGSAPAWPDAEVTVGLPNGHDWSNMSESVVPIKKIILQPDGVLCRSLRLKVN